MSLFVRAYNSRQDDRKRMKCLIVLSGGGSDDLRDLSLLDEIEAGAAENGLLSSAAHRTMAKLQSAAHPRVPKQGS